MPFRVSGKNIDVGETLRERVVERVNESVTKFFNGGYSGHATIGKEGFGFRTECVIHLDTGIVLHVDGLAADAYSSADQVALRLEKRLRRYKSKLKHPSRKNAKSANAPPDIDAASYVLKAPDHEAEDDDADFSPVVIAESTMALEWLSVSEAVVELDLTGSPIVVFRHATNGQMNVVYRRADGNIGWIDPPVAKAV